MNRQYQGSKKKARRRIATIKEEQEAWDKLEMAFPDNYISLEKCYFKYANGGEVKIEYIAYTSTTDHIGLSDHYKSPMEAVNDIIESWNKRMIKEGMKDGKAEDSHSKAR